MAVVTVGLHTFGLGLSVLLYVIEAEDASSAGSASGAYLENYTI